MALAVRRRPVTAESLSWSQSVHVRFVVDEVALGQVFNRTRQFSTRHYSTSLIFILICMLLVPGQTGEAWKPPKKHCSFGNRELGIENCWPFFPARGLGWVHMGFEMGMWHRDLFFHNASVPLPSSFNQSSILIFRCMPLLLEDTWSKLENFVNKCYCGYGGSIG
jgi:hypothetical protein